MANDIITYTFFSHHWPFVWGIHRSPVAVIRGAMALMCLAYVSLQWRYNEHDGVSNHWRLYCLLNRLFRHRAKKTSKLPVTGLCVGNSPGTGEFPAQKASNAENVSIWWHHHSNVISLLLLHINTYGDFLNCWAPRSIIQPQSDTGLSREQMGMIYGASAITTWIIYKVDMIGCERTGFNLFRAKFISEDIETCLHCLSFIKNEIVLVLEIRACVTMTSYWAR